MPVDAQTNVVNQLPSEIPGDSSALISVVVIALVAGIVGGIAAYWAEPSPSDPATAEPARTTLRRFLILGIVASVCVPLFLSLLRSDLLTKVLGGQHTAGAFESYLIFTGLCLVAAFSARRFIDSVTQQVLRRAEDANRNAEHAQEIAREARETAIEAAVEVESVDSNEPVPAAAREDVQPGETASGPLSDDERRALQALTAKPYRTRTGVAEDARISRNRVSEILESLAERRLALPSRSPTTGGARWIITDRGRSAIGAA